MKKVLGINGRAVDSLQESVSSDTLRIDYLIALQDFANPRRMSFGAKNGSSEPVLRFPAGEGVVLEQWRKGAKQLYVSIKIDAAFMVDGVHPNNVGGECPTLSIQCFANEWVAFYGNILLSPTPQTKVWVEFEPGFHVFLVGFWDRIRAQPDVVELAGN